MHVIASPGAGGAEMFVKDLSLSMKKNHHTVMVVFVSHASDLHKDIDFEANFLETLSKNQIAFRFIGHTARINPIKGMFKLRAITKQFKPDVVHCHLSYAVVFSALIADAVKVFTYHSFKLKEPKSFFRIADWLMDGFVGISSRCKQNLSTVIKSDITCIPNGVDANRLASKPAPCKHQTFTISMLGRLGAEKNYPLLIAAVSHLKDLDFQILIAGEGPDECEIREEIKKNDSEKHIKLVGNIVDVATFLKSSHLFLLCSSWEGLPIALIEASLCQLPVVVTDVGGCAELVSDIKNGVVIPPEDSLKLAEALRTLICSKRLREEYSENARKHAHLYSIETADRLHIELYQRLISSKN